MVSRGVIIKHAALPYIRMPDIQQMFHVEHMNIVR